jgi:Na+/H+ antiporter NhaC
MTETQTNDDWSDAFTLRRVAGCAVTLVLAALILPYVQPDDSTAQTMAARLALRDHLTAVEETARARDATADDPMPLELVVDGLGPEPPMETLTSELQRSNLLTPRAGASDRLHLSVGPVDNRAISIQATWEHSDAESQTVFEAQRPSGHWTAVLPPLVAITLALFFQRIILALGAAVWLGAALRTGFAPLESTGLFVTEYVWPSIASPFHLYITGFTVALVGMVHVIIRMGGIAGILESLAWMAGSVRSTRVAAALMGLALFFDDYANTVVVGSTMRPLTDEKNISREKLAYIVDSTSAPIAGLAVISTWIGYEVGLFDELSRQIQLGMSGYEIFFQILPLRFYCIFALVYVGLIAWRGLDYGPMFEAERRAATTGQVRRRGSRAVESVGSSETDPKPGIPNRWYNAAIPVAVVVFGAIFGLYWSGWRGPGGNALPGFSQLLALRVGPGELLASLGTAASQLTDWTVWREALSRADNAKVLFGTSMAGSLVAIGLAVGQGLLNIKESIEAWFQAIPMMAFAIAILILAWAIQGVCSDLGTSAFLTGTVQGVIAPIALPLLIFGLAAVVAFATGTSWGTMGILLPAMIPLAYTMTQPLESGSLLLMMCFGAVLDGAIFGDHCSPISDTTVMSSIASGVDHVDHVRTQLPYALTTMGISVLFGYLGVALGLPLWATFLFGILGLWTVLELLGHDPRDEAAVESS